MTALTARSRDTLTAIGFGLLAFGFRIWHLSTPKGFVFDEVYYAKNAYSLLKHGVEISTSTKIAEFIVHPPVGKWLIAIGIKIFGYNEFGWRISSAVFGSVAIVLIYFTARKLFNNYFLSCSAAFLMTIDGLELVHSRVALLDLFLMFFLLVALLAILYSNHWIAGIALGLAAGTKWSGLYSIIAYFAFVLYVDYRNYRALERERALLVTIREKAPLRVLQYGVLPVVTYIATWTGWFVTKTGWDRNWSNGKSNWSFIPSVIRNFWHYHAEILNFHAGLTTKHSYSANPWSWLIMGRPTSFFYGTPKTCGAASCSQEVIALGTPFLWWTAVFAIAITFGYWISRREWQSGLILLSLGAAYLPWFLFQKRTMFSFYSIAFEPFIILVIIFCMAKFLERDDDPRILRIRKFILMSGMAVIAINFLYFLPLYTGGVLTYSSWFGRMWFPSWI